MDLTRRGFLGLAPCFVAPVTARLGPGAADPHSGFPSQDVSLVQGVVGASHANLARVKELVSASPALAKSAYDWGFGDWETAIGAASHTGRREIAEYLMSHGARPDVFTYAMLGDLAAVKASVEAVPGVQRTPGPHGISMLSHARAGGEKAKQVYDYLLALGDADPQPESRPISDQEKAEYVGKFWYGDGADDYLEALIDARGSLALRRGTSASRVLHRVEADGFAPAGAPAVRIRFGRSDGRPVSVTVFDPGTIATGVRRGE